MFKTPLLIIFLLCPITSLANTACVVGEPPKTYLEFKKTVDAEIKTFSNKKSIAEKADETLSKLIAAKSPVITGWMSKRNLDTESEEKIIQDWRDYFARNFILTQYPHKNPKVDQEIEKLMAAINKNFAPPDFRKKMQDHFAKSKTASLALVKTFPIKEDVKEKILTRIQNIQMYWMKDFKTSKYKELPLDFLDWGIAYDPKANEINMGVNSLAYPNEETYLAVFLHEIGHSFDSLRWTGYFEGEWPFQRIGDCLRSSVGAKKREGAQLDQLPETFADWFSAEALATLDIKQVSNIRNDLCVSKELSPGSSYITNELRLKGIYFAHPKLKNPTDKPSPIQYCTFTPREPSSLRKVSIISGFDDVLRQAENTGLIKAALKLFEKDLTFTGMAELYRGVLRKQTEPHFFLVSAISSLFQVRIDNFLEETNFPPHKNYLRNWLTEWSIETFKIEKIRAILSQRPADQFIIIFDNSAASISLAEALNKDFSDQIVAIYLRQVVEKELPAKAIGFYTAFDIALHEYQAQRLDISELHAVGQKIIEEKNKNLLFPAYAVCPKKYLLCEGTATEALEICTKVQTHIQELCILR